MTQTPRTVASLALLVGLLAPAGGALASDPTECAFVPVDPDFRNHAWSTLEGVRNEAVDEAVATIDLATTLLTEDDLDANVPWIDAWRPSETILAAEAARAYALESAPATHRCFDSALGLSSTATRIAKETGELVAASPAAEPLADSTAFVNRASCEALALLELAPEDCGGEPR